MTDDPHGARDIPLGTQVLGFNGAELGYVREVYPHYFLVGQEGEHADLEVPVHAILRFAEGQLHVSVNRSSVTEVDDVETAHRMGQE
ncbi:MAG: hypothetical protein K0S99_2830 [Thermomicrobiales bacterium]|jgi:hypothetical protein|nr:hypothetical protein [Thermomicrobiales bacterium]